jgi:hypothetical protein
LRRRDSVVRERFLRIEAIGISTEALGHLLEITEVELAQWIIGVLPTERADVIEVGLSLIEMHHATPTLKLAAVAAA